MMEKPERPTPLHNPVLSQIGLVVRNAERTAEKFSVLTGCNVPAPIFLDAYEKARTEFRGKPSQASAKLIIFEFGPVSLEIIEPIGADSTWHEFLETHGEGVHHIAFTVKDADQTAKAYAANGVPVLQRGLFDGGQYVYLDVEQTLGFVFELLEFNSR